MKIDRYIKLVACVLLFSVCVSIVGCGKRPDNTQNSESTIASDIQIETNGLMVDNSHQDFFAQIVKSERIDLDEAYNLLNSIDTLGEDEASLYKTLSELKNCSGRFVELSEETGDRYTADVAFYLAYGEIYCSIDYTGYMGKISDGLVSKSQQNGYSFEAFPKGDLYGKEQDFKIYFGNEKLYIAWADICEYTLTRGNGSADSVQEHRGDLEETGILDSIISVVDSSFADFEHSVVYDKKNRALYIYIQGTDNLRDFLATTNNPDAIELWQVVTDNSVRLSKEMYDVLHSYVDSVYVCWVDTLKASNTYSQSEVLLQTENGTIKYNVIADNANVY